MSLCQGWNVFEDRQRVGGDEPGVLPVAAVVAIGPEVSDIYTAGGVVIMVGMPGRWAATVLILRNSGGNHSVAVVGVADVAARAAARSGDLKANRPIILGPSVHATAAVRLVVAVTGINIVLVAGVVAVVVAVCTAGVRGILMPVSGGRGAVAGVSDD